MKVGIYTIKDLVADECGPVFSAKNDEVAGRNFRDLMKKENIGNSDEYRLFCVGYYDPEEMMFYTFITDVKFEFKEVNVKSWKQIGMEN